MSDDTEMDPRQYYDELGDGEWERLDANPVARLEFENTTDYLAERLPDAESPSDPADDSARGDSDPVRVLDAGGGPGRYACWLAERGYEVQHTDLSNEQVSLARENVAKRNVEGSVTCQQADVRDLPFPDDSFDAVCCLGGVLSHVVDPAEREQAIRELRRVATPDAPTFVSVIGRLATLRDIAKHVLDGSHGLLVPLAEDGDYTDERVERLADGEGWAECHFFRADEFERELADAGLSVDRLVGLEGPVSRLQAELADADDAAIADVRAMLREVREDRSVVDTSEHMLAVCRA
ncbi:class I SAM-dependent methyltransferase [Halorussus ruber]|uniref:class I SAM-dependent methyltransferase n=1 Tax=Halorussus ruber TaxID=1126238 RepID=UPI001092712D|nr:class I SAM-dependent methyltransferase [Halorussus ruber]